MATTYDRHVFKQLQDVLKKCDNLSQEIKDIKKEHREEIFKLNEKHKQEINDLKEEHKKEINDLNIKIDALEIENKILKEDNTRMKSILNKDSTNSSIPPSKDERPKKKKINLREKTNKKSGGQKKHKGATFTKEMVEKLKNKEGVKTEIITHGNENGKYYIPKYEIDTKTIVILKEHRFYYNKRKELKLPKEFKTDVQYGEELKTLCSIMSVEEVISLERIEEFIGILTGGLLNISQGSIVNWIKELSNKCRPAIKEIKKALKNSEKIHTDLTETKEAGTKRQVRVYGTQKHTVYIASKDKKIIRVKRQWILNGYTGYIIHDHDTGLYNYGLRNKHVECNVHLRRYLKSNSELTGHEWSKKMDELLLEIKAEKEKMIFQDIHEFSKEQLEEYSKNMMKY